MSFYVPSSYDHTIFYLFSGYGHTIFNHYDALDWRQGKYWDVIYVFIYPITFVYGGSYIYCYIFTRI